MKKVLFIVTYFDCGGTCRALQNLLNKIDIQYVSVDVFGMVEEGMYRNEFKNCSILPENTWLRALIARYSQQKGIHKYQCFVAKLFRKLTNGWFKDRILYSVATKLIKNKTYDAVIAFSEGEPTKLVSFMKHPNKIAWIHCDYASYYEQNHKHSEKSIYENFNTVICVSHYTSLSFLKIYPEFYNKTRALYNIVDDNMMKQMAKEPLSVGFSSDNLFKIISIGRLDPIKRLSAIPSIAAVLKETGCKFSWIIVGPKGGTDEEYNKLIAEIKKYQVEDCVIWLGQQSNPYNFIINSDLLVCTSISEACPYVVNEAKLLQVPVICTNFKSAEEFIKNGVNGYVLPIEQFPETIHALINRADEYQELKENLKEFKYNNKEIVEAIYKLF